MWLGLNLVLKVNSTVDIGYFTFVEFASSLLCRVVYYLFLSATLNDDTEMWTFNRKKQNDCKSKGKGKSAPKNRPRSLFNLGARWG